MLTREQRATMSAMWLEFARRDGFDADTRLSMAASLLRRTGPPIPSGPPPKCHRPGRAGQRSFRARGCSPADGVYRFGPILHDQGDGFFFREEQARCHLNQLFASLLW